MRIAELDKLSLAFYTGKWFLLWSFKFLCLGLMAVGAITTFLLASCHQANRSNN
ncbi:MAG: hypothetical protein WC919_02075 [Candidatus Paceibacterota bacterium]|jgi:hypothetical protein